jgi:molybdopterin-guanine dinucleotide biosynthesis protein A
MTNDSPQQSDLSTVIVILAGGEGRRLGGVDKATVELGGRRLVDVAISRAKRWRLPVVISVRRPAPWHAALDVPVVLDDTDHAGPLAGVCAVMSWAPMNVSCLVSLTVDCPFLPDDLVARLTNTTLNGAIAVAESDGVRHHLIAAWPRTTWPAIRSAVQSGVTAVHKAQACQRTIAVNWPLSPTDPFFNVNTPSDLHGAEEISR